MTIRTRPTHDMRIVIFSIDAALEDIAAFIEATERCQAVGVPVQHNVDVLAMLRHLQVRLTVALDEAL